LQLPLYSDCEVSFLVTLFLEGREIYVLSLLK